MSHVEIVDCLDCQERMRNSPFLFDGKDDNMIYPFWNSYFHMSRIYIFYLREGERARAIYARQGE